MGCGQWNSALLAMVDHQINEDGREEIMSTEEKIVCNWHFIYSEIM
jgi:hypothetical protein